MVAVVMLGAFLAMRGRPHDDNRRRSPAAVSFGRRLKRFMSDYPIIPLLDPAGRC